MILHGPHAEFDVSEPAYEEFQTADGWRCQIAEATLYALGDDINESIISVRSALADEVCRIWCENIWAPAWRSKYDKSVDPSLWTNTLEPYVQQHTDEIVALVKSLVHVVQLPPPYRACGHKRATPFGFQIEEAGGIFHASAGVPGAPGSDAAEFTKIHLGEVVRWLEGRRTLGVFTRGKK